jgi:hypothetical protein
MNVINNYGSFPVSLLKKKGSRVPGFFSSGEFEGAERVRVFSKAVSCLFIDRKLTSNN